MFGAVVRLLQFENEEILARVIEPSGVISKEDRIRAESLDELLQVRVPEIADEVLDEVPEEIEIPFVMGDTNPVTILS